MSQLKFTYLHIINTELSKYERYGMVYDIGKLSYFEAFGTTVTNPTHSSMKDRLIGSALHP